MVHGAWSMERGARSTRSTRSKEKVGKVGRMVGEEFYFSAKYDLIKSQMTNDK